jgi:hypothetical protein
MKRLALVAVVFALAACVADTSTADSVRIADSIAAKTRTDSIARADSLARALADSLGRDSIARGTKKAPPPPPQQ